MKHQKFNQRLIPVAIALAALAPLRVGALDIVINAGATLQGNIPALNAFNRAAALWEARFSDPITVTIDADLVSIGNPNIIGQAGSFLLADNFDFTRGLMVLDAADEPSNGIVSALPTSAQFSALLPNGFTLGSGLVFTKANGKAMGYDAAIAPFTLDGLFGASDATIQFNTGFSFDYDNSNGVGGGQMDFETVAAHEIGHSLGFVSAVDDVDFLITQESPDTINPYALDLFRFERGGAFDPANPAEFTLFPRNLTPGGTHIFDALDAEYLFSTGVDHGDGSQASHWADNLLIGVMDPTLALGELSPITAADIRAFDLIGWDVVVPEPSTYAAGAFALVAVGGVWLRSRRRA